MVEDSKSNRCLPYTSCTDESDRFEIFCECDDLLNQLVASETGPGSRGREFTRRNANKRKTVDSVVSIIANLA